MNFLETVPDGFRARFAVAFASEEAAQLGDQAQYLVEPTSLYTSRFMRPRGAARVRFQRLS